MPTLHRLLRSGVVLGVLVDGADLVARVKRDGWRVERVSE